MTRPNLKYKIFSEGEGVSHLSMTRPNVKFIISLRVGGGGKSSFHDKTKAEI